MTFLEVIEVVMQDLDELMEDTEVLNKVKNYINRGYRELARREGVSKSATKEVVDGSVMLPEDCVELIDVRYGNDYVDYFLEGRKIIVVDEIEEIRLIYSYLVDKLVRDGDSLDTADCNVEFIINFAKYLYYLNDYMPEEASLFKNEMESLAITRNDTITHKLIDVYGGYL